MSTGHTESIRLRFRVGEDGPERPLAALEREAGDRLCVAQAGRFLIVSGLLEGHEYELSLIDCTLEAQAGRGGEGRHAPTTEPGGPP